MSRRNLLFLSIFVLGAVLGRIGADPAGVAALVGPKAVQAGEVELGIEDGDTFVTTDGPNAYLWERTGDRLVLLGHASRIQEGEAEQASFVWMPGVEQRTFIRP